MVDPSSPSQQNKNWFNQHAPAPFKTNRRLGVRFVRNDISVTLCKAGTLNLAFPILRSQIPATLIDISSRGILIEFPKKLHVNKKVLLTISFMDGRQFLMLGTIVRKEANNVPRYGIKFDKLNNKLAEHLLHTQKILTFK